MELRQLRYFCEIIRVKNYSHAAKNLFVTQPTLSWNMTKLQDELGVKLMYQVGNIVMPTTAGMALYEKSFKVIEELDQFADSVKADQLTEKKEIKIGSNRVISPVFMPLIRQFMEVYPNFLIMIEEDGSVKTQKKVVNEELEIGIVSYPITETDLDIERNIFHTFQYNAAVIMHEDHPLAKKSVLTMEDLKNEAFSSMSDDYVLWNVLQNSARENGIKANINFVSNNHDVLIKNVLNDGSVALMPVELQEAYLHHPLVWVPIKDKIKPFDIVIVHKKNKPLSPAAALCLEFITNQKIKEG